jgi:hypothetical protein
MTALLARIATHILRPILLPLIREALEDHDHWASDQMHQELEALDHR